MKNPKTLSDAATEADGLPLAFGTREIDDHLRHAAALARLMRLAMAAIQATYEGRPEGADLEAFELTAKTLEAHILCGLANQYDANAEAMRAAAEWFGARQAGAKPCPQPEACG